MIDYNLAKKLKEARFPNSESWSLEYRDGVARIFNEGLFKCPTLSELIDACGERFKNLWLTDENGWGATGTLAKDTPALQQTLYAKTKEEAVAELWLKLNETD